MLEFTTEEEATTAATIILQARQVAGIVDEWCGSPAANEVTILWDIPLHIGNKFYIHLPDFTYDLGDWVVTDIDLNAVPTDYVLPDDLKV
jgi:hypothetical protein